MEEIKDIKEAKNILNNIRYDLNIVNEYLAENEDLIREQNKSMIKDIDNLKRELKRDGLYSNRLEEFLENYMKYYNK